MEKEKDVEIIEISDEVKKAYIDYAMSVIVSRALPSVEDGLKPVQRRILYTMYQMGLFADKPTKKTARIVGECLGKYHPHGDMAVYEALVRMAQDFSLRYPLVWGQGNMGSIDGDPPAAMRYTEAKLSKIAEEMLEDIEKDTVDFIPNFDNTEKEPLTLPSKFPNLLVNGSYGIAVGMATNILPHNFSEVVDGVIAYITNPEISIEELNKKIKGPDFPTGNTVYADEIIEVYKKGKGKITIRGSISVEEKKGKKLIVIKEIPYQVNKANLVQEIAKLIEEKKIEAYGVRDESTKKGIRIVIPIRKEANEKIIINRLFHLTSLETQMNVINVALVNGVPKLLNLKDLIKYWVDYRVGVVKRRTNFLLKEAKEREEIANGLIVALNNIEAIISLIRKSESVNQAAIQIMERFGLTKKQAQAIMDMKLSKLTKLEKEKLEKEIEELRKKIKEYEEILASKEKILEIIKKELLELKKKYGDERRTRIEERKKEIKEIELVKKEDVVITLTYRGYINVIGLNEFKEQKRGGKGIIGSMVGEDDYINKIIICSTHDNLLFVTNRGNVFLLKAYEIQKTSRYSRGKHVSNLIKIQAEEKLKEIIPIKTGDEKKFLIFVTRKGTVKKTRLEEFKNVKRSGIRAIKIPFDDEVVDAFLIEKDEEIIIATKGGMAIRFNTKEIREMRRAAYGVRGIKLKQDEVVAASIVKKNEYLLTITSKGYGKKTNVEEYRLIKKGGVGVKNILINEKTGFVVGVKCVGEKDEVVLITKKGMIIRFNAKEIRNMRRASRGVRVIKLKKDDEVIDMDVIKAIEEKSSLASWM
jgi:DNA gyrase subunit A